MHWWLQQSARTDLSLSSDSDHRVDFRSTMAPIIKSASTLNIFPTALRDLAGVQSGSQSSRRGRFNSEARKKQQIALDVAQSFLQVVLDQQLVRIAKKNLVASQDREKLLTEQTRVGVRNLADLFRQQAQTSADESFLANSRK